MAAARREPKPAAASLAAVSAFVGLYGFSTALGFGATGLRTGSEIVASCGSGMTFAYNTGLSATGGPDYVVNGIELSNIPPGCRGKRLSATFYGSSGTTVGLAIDATSTASGTTQDISVTPGSSAVDAAQVTGVSVVVA